MSKPSALKIALKSPVSRTLATFAAMATLVGFVPHRERGLLDIGASNPQALAAKLIPNTAFASLAAPTTASRLFALVGGTDPRRERFAPASGARTPSIPGVPGATGNQSIIPMGGDTPSAVPEIGGPLPPAGGGIGPGGNGPGDGGDGPSGNGNPPGDGFTPGGGGGGGSITPPIAPPEPPIIGGPVPEPGVWAMMILGISLIGGAMRRRSGTADRSRGVTAG